MNKSTKTIKIKKLEAMIKEVDKNKKVVINDTGIVWYEAIKRLLKRLIAEAKVDGKNTVDVPVKACEFIETMTRNINVMANLKSIDNDVHAETEKVLRRYTKATKWNKDKKMDLSELEKKEFALMLTYMIEKDLYSNEINKTRRKELEKLHGKHLNQEAYDEATDWACKKGYCEDRVSDMVKGYIGLISPKPTVFNKKKKKKNVA